MRTRPNWTHLVWGLSGCPSMDEPAIILRFLRVRCQPAPIPRVLGDTAPHPIPPVLDLFANNLRQTLRNAPPARPAASLGGGPDGGASGLKKRWAASAAMSAAAAAAAAEPASASAAAAVAAYSAWSFATAASSACALAAGVWHTTHEGEWRWCWRVGGGGPGGRGGGGANGTAVCCFTGQVQRSQHRQQLPGKSDGRGRWSSVVGGPWSVALESGVEWGLSS